MPTKKTSSKNIDVRSPRPVRKSPHIKDDPREPRPEKINQNDPREPRLQTGGKSKKTQKSKKTKKSKKRYTRK